MVESTNNLCQSDGCLWPRLLGLLYRTAAKYRLSGTILLYHTSPTPWHSSNMLGGRGVDTREEAVEQHARALVNPFADQLFVVACTHTEDETAAINFD